MKENVTEDNSAQSFTITPVRAAEEVQIVRELFEEYAEWLQVDLCFQSFAEELAGLPGEYQPPSGELLLARAAEGAVAGCVAFHACAGAPGVAELKRLYVVPEQRGRGVGKGLIAAAAAAARLRGYERMRLDTMASRMGPAIRLYREFGFREIAAYRHNPMPDAVFMELELSA